MGARGVRLGKENTEKMCKRENTSLKLPTLQLQALEYLPYMQIQTGTLYLGSVCLKGMDGMLSELPAAISRVCARTALRCVCAVGQ